MLHKIVHAGVTSGSFEQGSEDLAVLAEVDVPAKQVERVARRIGQERQAERAQEVEAYQQQPLVERKRVPEKVPAPDVAVVGTDGGRLQILERGAAAEEAEEALPAEEGRSGRHWREDKIGLLMTMSSAESASDPCPEIPEQFVDPTRILKLARELKKQALPAEDGLQETAEPEVGAETLAEQPQQWEPPEVKQKRLVASRCRWPDFGPQVATAAWAWGFFGAARKAFLGDGSDNNWTMWRQYFSSFTPILDFIHALSYVFAAAMAGRSFPVGWKAYQQWIAWVWQGEVERVIAALAERQMELGIPDKDESQSSPRSVVAKALGYLQNHQERMRYPEYRRRGLPITSSYVESAVKQFNQRVKGTEKFWSEDGAEGILQLRADYLSDNKPLEGFWQRREASETGQRRYRRAA
ncbi:MAG TPA: hypothetical protein VI653_15010 [Steroidobacteraceae bacterium]